MLVPVNESRHKKIAKGFFVTGTDTNVGKTLIAASLSLVLINSGKRVCAIKPLASGCGIKNNKIFSNDGLMLKRYSTDNNLSYADINPFAFRDPVAPHLAAKKNGIKLSVVHIIKKTHRALTSSHDYIIIEGAGGWLTPINNRETIGDLAKAYGYPVILVVGIKLGCINHTFLTYKCIQSSGIQIAGWVANIIDKKMLYLKENIRSIKVNIKAPLLGVVPYMYEIKPQKVTQFLQVGKLIEL